MISVDEIDDATAAAAFRRLVRHLQHRDDAANVDLMGLAGFCRNCLADWTAEASGGAIDQASARGAINGMPYAEWKAKQPEASAEQIARMKTSLARNAAPGA